MRRLVARSLWRLVGRRIGWVAVATLARTALRRGASRQVDEASADLEQRLPEPVRTVLDRVPGDAIRVGGSAVVAGRSARQVAAGAGRVSRAADDGRRRLGRNLDRATTAFDARPRPVRSGRELAARFGVDVRAETDNTDRDLRSRMLLNSRGRGAADDALLDRRPDRPEIIDADIVSPGTEDWWEQGADDLAETPAPVRPGRWRAPRRRAREQVARVQRTYQRPRRSWER